jgi:hypothetical protein
VRTIVVTALALLGIVAANPDVIRAAEAPAPDIDSGAWSRARLQVRVYDTTAMSAADRAIALRAAAGALSAAGIDVDWLVCGRHATTPVSCDEPVGRAELSVRIVSQTASPSAAGHLQLGYSLVDTARREGALATVFADRVQWLAVQAGAETPVVLGFAVAHEIGHLLLGTNTHAAGGLMRAIWSRLELQHGQNADWEFSAREGESMRRALWFRQLQMAANGDWNR